jgi:hypothetical protein
VTPFLDLLFLYWAFFVGPFGSQPSYLNKIVTLIITNVTDYFVSFFVYSPWAFNEMEMRVQIKYYRSNRV